VAHLRNCTARSFSILTPTAMMALQAIVLDPVVLAVVGSC
jgi:hypothetical protein